MTLQELVFYVARHMLFVERPLILGTYRWDPDEGNALATWTDADPFTRSEYTRRAFRHIRVMSGTTMIQAKVWTPGGFGFQTLTNQGCLCPNVVGLPSELLKNPNIRECQRCGGDT